MTNNKQQTAVEWYIDELEKYEKGTSKYFSIPAIQNHARRMEKERMIDFANNCIKQIEVSDTCELLMVESPKDLYEQTYGGGEQ